MKPEQQQDGTLTLRQPIGRGNRTAVILVPVLIFLTLILAGVLVPESFVAVLNAVFTALMVHGGWLVSLGTLCLWCLWW